MVMNAKIIGPIIGVISTRLVPCYMRCSTDRTPFDSNDEDYVRQRQVAFKAAPPHLISADVPESVSKVVMRLLEREPEKRISSAPAFQAALDGAIDL